MPVDWSQAPNGRAECKGQIRRFVHGIRRPRENPVTAKQIEQWCNSTPADFVSECIDELLRDGEIRIWRRSLSSGRRANGAYVYTTA
ncbi:MAG: hypothetical protein AAGL24_10160 [Pseudomonadota bacterium]